MEVVEIRNAREAVGGILQGGFRIVAGRGRLAKPRFIAVALAFTGPLLFALNTPHCWAAPVARQRRRKKMGDRRWAGGPF